MHRFKHTYRALTISSVIALGLALSSPSYAQAKLYRYINDRGVVVIDYSIPSQYVPYGYEVLNNRGQVVEKIEPTPTGKELEAKQQQQDIFDDYKKLKRRYSNIDDIERAKQRKLENLETNIAILNGNISGLNSNMETLIAQAAKQERLGRTVSKTLLEKMETLKKELSVANNLLRIRQEESTTIVNRYEDEKVRFEAGESLLQEWSISSK